LKKTFSKKKAIASAALALGLIIPQATPSISYADVVNEDIVSLRIIETTDLHANVMNYDYFKNGITGAYGLTKASSLIKQARGEVKNSLLFDNGDTIQGSPIGDYVVNQGLMVEGYVHPMLRAMHLLGYDAQTVGNHEFNYGLDFMNETLDDAQHPIVNANVYDATTNTNYFKPFEILEREVEDADGEKHIIKIGVTGFVPPDIMKWDAKHLEGKLVVKDIIEAANEVIPQMEAAGADIIVALAHSGIADYDQNGNIKPYQQGAENTAYYLSQVPGINAILTGHQHLSFPNTVKPSFKDGNGIDNTTGTINGVPTLMPGSWGNNIGLIDLTVEKLNGEWIVRSGGAKLRPITDAPVDTEMEAAVAVEHAATIEYMNSPVGELTGDMNTFFSLVKDNASMEIVNRAQSWYVEKALKGTQYEGLPILSAAAPFKAGSRGGSENYTNVPAGTITIRNIADLYLYDNNVVHALKVTGSDVREWLEWSAGQFNQIDPNKTGAQDIINNNFPTYNFDVIDGVTYEIDVRQPTKYDSTGKVIINPNSSRIKNLKYNGKPVTNDMEFIVATNDYRSAGVFFNAGMPKTIFRAPDSNRQVVSDYVKENVVIDATVNNNWSFTPINTNAFITFQSNVRAKDQLSQYADITYTGQVDASGFGIYQLNLKQDIAPEVQPKPTTPAPTPTPAPATPVFTDVAAGHWAKTYVDELVKLGHIKGVTDTTFEPESKLTRGQFISMIVRAMGLSDGKGTIAQEIEIAYKNGVTTLEPAVFGADQLISREQMAAMIVRAYEKKTGKDFTATTTVSYKDGKNISVKLAAEVAAAKELGFMGGYKNGTFGPKENANRAQGAKVVFDFLKK
jgi:2',3'-cyclic-nucleotide 2'-phosphodiesterase / 3'-nucleotidase